MSDYTLFIKRVGLIGIVRLLGRAQGLILLPILAKTLGAAGYGVWAQIGVTIALMMPFVMAGLPSAMLRFLPEAKEKKDFAKGFFMVFFAVFFISIIGALVLFLLSKQFSFFLLKDASVILLVQVASLLIILETLNTVVLEPFRIIGKIKEYSILNIFQIIIETGLVGFLVFSGFGLWGAIIGLLITKGITLSLSLFILISHIGFTLPDFSRIRPYLMFGLPLIPSTLFLFLIESSDRYVIGFFQGAASVGIYSVAYGLGVIPAVFMAPLSYILSPTVFRFYTTGEIEKVKNFLSYSLKYFLLFAIPATFGLFMLANSLLTILTTPEFILSTSALIVLLLSLSMIFEGVRAIFGTTLMIFKDVRNIARAVLIAGVMNLILNIIFVPIFGIVAAAITTFLAYLLLGGMYFYDSRKYLKFDINLPFIIKSILSSIVMVIAVYVLNPLGIMKILLSVGVGAIVYFLILFLLKGISKKEFNIFTRLLKLNKGYEKLQ